MRSLIREYEHRRAEHAEIFAHKAFKFTKRYPDKTKPTLDAQRVADLRRWRLLMDPMFRKRSERGDRRRQARCKRLNVCLRKHLYWAASFQYTGSSSVQLHSNSRVLRGAGGTDSEPDVESVPSPDNMQNVNASVFVHILNVESLTLRDIVPKALLRSHGAHEPDDSRRAKLETYVEKAYVSCETSGLHCACAMHASFGMSTESGMLFLENARQVAAKIIRQKLESVESNQESIRQQLLDLIHKELVLSYFEGDPDDFS